MCLTCNNVIELSLFALSVLLNCLRTFFLFFFLNIVLKRSTLPSPLCVLQHVYLYFYDVQLLFVGRHSVINENANNLLVTFAKNQ